MMEDTGSLIQSAPSAGGGIGDPRQPGITPKEFDKDGKIKPTTSQAENPGNGSSNESDNSN